MHAATSQDALLYFSPCPFFSSLIITRNKRIVCVCVRIGDQDNVQMCKQKQTWRPALGTAQYRCVGSSHLVPQMEQQKERVRECVCGFVVVFLCVIFFFFAISLQILNIFSIFIFILFLCLCVRANVCCCGRRLRTKMKVWV